jgi:hypothetical protein
MPGGGNGMRQPPGGIGGGGDGMRPPPGGPGGIDE